MAFRLALVVAQFNDDITGVMERVAREHAQKQGHTIVRTARVSGVYDLPLPADALAARKDVDGVACLGAIVKGDTQHDEIIGHACAMELSAVSVRRGKPVALGVIGPGASWEQAKARAAEYATRAVDAAHKSHLQLEEARK